MGERPVAALALVVGDRLGPVNAALMHFLDDEYDAGFGEVEAAPNIRGTKLQSGHSD
jgi:hypothetical protein